MRLPLVILLALQLATLGRLPELEGARAKKLYDHAFERVKPTGFDHSRLRELLQEDRELLLRWKRDEVESARARGTSEDLISLHALDLAILGDEWGIDVMAEKIRSRSGYQDHVCWLIRDARLVPKIGDLLFSEEQYHQEEGIGYWPKQWTIASGIIEILRYAPQFPPDVSNWAAELRRSWDQPVGVIDILREWYKENEQKLREGKFQEIRPGRVPIVKATDSREAVKEPRANDGAGQLPKAAATPGVNAVAETSGTPAWVLWGSGIFAILLALGVGVRRFLAKR